MSKLLIMIASKNDEVFLQPGIKFLKEQGIDHEIHNSSTHRDPSGTNAMIVGALTKMTCKVIIAGAATATGLPGVIAGYLLKTNIPVFGVRFSKEPGPNIIEDATFNLSSMPSGVPLAYTGFNEKGFLHACILAARIIKG
ncbi:MAG: AIR carboxylase family protein [Candidatus Parcubacteria bacterium]|nr:AIR carboxylase family protein [Candidatus Parcubacteria bacterium]